MPHRFPSPSRIPRHRSQKYTSCCSLLTLYSAFYFPLKNSLDYTAASFFGQCCNFIDIPAPFWSFFRRKTKNKNVSKKHLAYGKPLRYDRVDPPYGLFSSHRKLVPQKRCFVAFEGPYLFTDQCIQNASAMPGSLPMLQGRKMSSLPPARPTGVKSPLSGN